MMIGTVVVLALMLVTVLPLSAQRSRRGTQQPTAIAGAYNLPAVTFNGVLKEITGKAVVIESDDGQTVTLYRNHKTRFLQGEKTLKAKQIAPGTKLTIDVAKNPDASLLAVNVMVAAPSAASAAKLK